MVNLGGLGKKAIVNVTAPMGCAWTATTAASWFTVLPPNGNGNGSVTLTSTSNGSASQRADVATVAQQPVTVTQSAAAACAGTISSSGMDMAQAGGSGSFSLKADCSWSVATDSPWLTVTSPIGTGSDTIRFNVAANPGRSSRKGTLTVAGQAFTVRQEGQRPGRVNNVSVITSAK
jgi:hypothetical protein